MPKITNPYGRVVISSIDYVLRRGEAVRRQDELGSERVEYAVASRRFNERYESKCLYQVPGTVMRLVEPRARVDPLIRSLETTEV
jgi:hypothetical protein